MLEDLPTYAVAAACTVLFATAVYVQAISCYIFNPRSRYAVGGPWRKVGCRCSVLEVIQPAKLLSVMWKIGLAALEDDLRFGEYFRCA